MQSDLQSVRYYSNTPHMHAAAAAAARLLSGECRETVQMLRMTAQL